VLMTHSPLRVVIPLLLLSLIRMLFAASADSNVVFASRENPDVIRNYYRGFPVIEEGRWYVVYQDEQHGSIRVSKLFLGTASITLDQLKSEWPSWTEVERWDFCSALSSAPKQQLPNLLRFIMKNGNRALWADLAVVIVENLPLNEALPFIRRQCKDGKLEDGLNFLQALTLADDKSAIPLLSARLEQFRLSRDFYDNPEGSDASSVAYAALNCVEYLLALGVSPDDLGPALEALVAHPSPGIRKRLKELPGVSDSGVMIKPRRSTTESQQPLGTENSSDNGSE